MDKLVLNLITQAIFSGLVVEGGGTERRTKYGCEGSMLDIECEEGTMINLVRANYGRFSISICNGEGNTAWSVNCMEPRTLRVINTRCGSKRICSVPVESSIFGDPCPGTSKYVEVHYTCKPVPVSTSTTKPRPPWLLDLSATPSPDWKYKTTTSTTTSTTTATTTQSTTVSTTVPTVRSSLVTNAPVTITVTERITQLKSSTERSFVAQSEAKSLVDKESEFNPYIDHCHPTSVRGLFWNWTRTEEMAIQPCPGGSSGFARWRCTSNAAWNLDSPDLSECQAHWITRLETRLRNGESVIKVSTDLAAVTETRSLYGGDLLITTQLMQSLAHRLRQDLFSIASQEQKETLVTELMQNIQKTASNLLDDIQEAAWNDLRPVERASAGTSLILGIEENAFLVADTVNNEKNLVDVTNNILSSVRIMQSRDARPQDFPSLDSLHMAEEAHLEVPSQSVREHAVNGAVRLVFFLYDKMDRVLPSSTNGVKFLNSKVVSAAVSKGRHIRVTQPIKLTLKHIQSEGVSNPSCMWWDFVTRTWSDANCRVIATNSSHTSCHCSQFGNVAILMEEGLGVPPKSSEDMTQNIATIVGAVVSIIAGMCLAVVGFFIIRRLNLKTGLHKFLATGRLPCFHCRESKSGGLYPTINSSPTSTTLSSGTPTTSTTMSSNYFLNSECQIQDPVVLSPVGQHSTIYRTKLANGQQAHVIPVSHIQIQDPRNHFFRPVSPLGHIYMEIDPVYARLDPVETQSDLQLSDVSDDDLRRSSDISRQSSNRYAEERPLIRNTLRKSAPHQRQCQTSMKQPVRTVSGSCASSLRAANKARTPVFNGQGFRFDTPITIALSPGGDQFVSLNLDHANQGPQTMSHQNQRSFNSGV